MEIHQTSIGEPADGEEQAFWADPVWDVVQRVVVSPQFLRSHKLRAMLLYVSERAIRGQTDEITEQQIGVHVFGRRTDYNPGEDSIVRSQARFLRGKLESYFSGEGANEPIHITIPKGAYIPQFEPRSVNPEPLQGLTQLAGATLIDRVDTTSSLRTEDTPFGEKKTLASNKIFSRPWLKVERLCLIGVTISLIAVSTWVCIKRWDETAYLRRPTHAFWGKVFDAKHTTLIVPGDAGLAMLLTLSEHPVTLKDYTSGDYRLKLDSPGAGQADMTHLVGRRRYVTLVDMELSNRMLRQPEATKTHVVTEYARDANLDDLQHSNLILLGTRAINPWVELYWNSLDFVIERNFATGEFVIRNRRPRNGELGNYFLQTRGSQRPVFCALSFEVGKNGAGSVLILQGTTAVGVQACTEFMMDDARLGEVLSKARSGNNIKSFEVLLRTQSSANDPSQATVLALHLH